MKIAYLTYEYPPDRAIGGIATYVRQAALLMQSRGHEVEVFTSSGTRAGASVEDGIPVHWVMEDDRLAFSEAIRAPLAERHRAVRFDVVEAPEYVAEGRVVAVVDPHLALVVRMHTPSALLWEINSSPYSRRNAWRRSLGRAVHCTAGVNARAASAATRFIGHLPQSVARLDAMERRSAIEADVIASPSFDLCGFARRRWGIASRRIRHLPYPYVPSQALLELPASSNDGAVGYFGRIERRKGVLDLAKAIPLVLSRFPAAKFRFVGADTHDVSTGRSMQQLIREIVGDQTCAVEFVGPVTPGQIPEELARVGVCVLPSIWENFPNTCLESMTAGRAVVGSSAGGMAEMLDGGRCGRLVPPRSPAKIAAAVCGLLADRGVRVAIGDAARSRVLSLYCADAIAPQMEQCYLDAVESRRGRRVDATTRAPSRRGSVG